MPKELSEDLSSIKKTQSEMKDTLIEIKNNLHRTNSRVDKAEIQISDLEHKEAKNNQSEQQEQKRIQKNEDSVKVPLGQLQAYLMGVLKGEEKEQEIGNLFEKIMKENFPNLLKEIDMHVQKAQRVPNKRESKRPTHPLEDTS